MTTLPAPTRRFDSYLGRRWYRDGWAHLDADARIEIRREYRHLRQLGLNPLAAKGVLYRTVATAKGWD